MANNEFNRFSFAELVFGPLRLFRESVGRLFDSQSFGASSDSVSAQNIITFPFRLLWATLAFGINVWSSSRIAKAFIGGLPAVLIGLALLSAMTILPWLLKVDIKSQQIYAVQYARFTEPKRDDYGRVDPKFKVDLPKATICAQRLMDATPSENDPRFLYAKVLPPHRRNEAKEIMETLASTETMGFIPAHTWLANDAISSMSTSNDPTANREFARKHLAIGSGAKIEDMTNDSAQASIALSNLYVMEKDYATAEKILETLMDNIAALSKSRPELISSGIAGSRILLQIYKETGADDKYDRLKQSIINQFSDFGKQKPDNFELWRYLVGLLVMSKEYENALEVCQTALKIVPRKMVPDIEQLRSVVYIEHANSISVIDEATFQSKLALFSEAIVSSPLLPDAYMGLITLVQSDTEAEQRQIWLENSLLTNKYPLISQVLIGFQAGLAGDWENCEVNWRLAQLKDRSTPIFVGLLLRATIAKEKDRTPATRKMVEIGLKLYPDQPQVKFDQAILAIEDKDFANAKVILEEIVKTAPSLFEARIALLKTYEELGLKDQIEIQMQEIEKIKSDFVRMRDLR